jgi:hypothetical protein
MIAETITKHMTSAGPAIATISNAYPEHQQHSLQHLISLTAWATGQTHEGITGRDRFMRLIKARSIMAKVARRFYSLKQIARALNRSHSTIINLLHSFDEFAAIDEDFQKTYKRVLYNL